MARKKRDTPDASDGNQTPSGDAQTADAADNQASAQEQPDAQAAKRKSRLRNHPVTKAILKGRETAKARSDKKGGKRKRNGPTAARNVKALERALEAWEYRKRGYTFEQIAEWCGYNGPQAAYMAIKRLREEAVKVSGEEALDVYTGRVELMFQTFFTFAETGDTFAAGICEKALDRMERLHGFNKPTKIAPTNPEGDGPAQLGPMLNWADVLAGAQRHAAKVETPNGASPEPTAG